MQQQCEYVQVPWRLSPPQNRLQVHPLMPQTARCTFIRPRCPTPIFSAAAEAEWYGTGSHACIRGACRGRVATHESLHAPAVKQKRPHSKPKLTSCTSDHTALQGTQTGQLHQTFLRLTLLKTKFGNELSRRLASSASVRCWCSWCSVSE